MVAREWGQYNIRGNTVCPGGWTENVTARLKEQKPEIQEWAQHAFRDNPLQSIEDPHSDVSLVFVFLASDDSHWITGQNVHADGGVCITA